MRGFIHTRTATVSQTIALIFLLVYMGGCAMKPTIPTASNSDFENSNPLRISKEEANRIKVVTITTFPLPNAMSPPMMGMTSMRATVNPVAFLTDTISDKVIFQVIPQNEFRKKLAESHETFDKTLTQGEVQAIAQKVGESLGADAVVIVEMDSQQAGPRLGMAALGPAFQAGYTGTTTQAQTIKMYVVSTDSNKVIWQQTLKRNVTHALDGSQSDEVMKSAISPLVDNLHQSFL
jgi:uncharacterized protein YbjQ (UPF0145 family)